MIHTSIVLSAPTALADTTTGTGTIMVDMVALETAGAGKMNGVGLVIATGPILMVRLVWGLVR